MNKLPPNQSLDMSFWLDESKDEVTTVKGKIPAVIPEGPTPAIEGEQGQFKEEANPLPYSIEEEVDLLEYVHEIGRRKWWVALAALLAAVAMYFYAKTIPNIYVASVKAAMTQSAEVGGISPQKMNAPEVLTLMERDFIMDKSHDNLHQRILARMNSLQFGAGFIQRHNLLQVIFSTQWDSENETWLNGFEPDINAAYLVFTGSIRAVTHNPENQILAISMTTKDPALSATLANAYVAEFNEHMRQRKLDETNRKLEFLKNQLKHTDNILVEKSIYRLMEIELATITLVNAKKSFAIEVLDPAVPPLMQFSPARGRMVILTFFGVYVFGMIGVIGRILFGKIGQGLKNYRQSAAVG